MDQRRPRRRLFRQGRCRDQRQEANEEDSPEPVAAHARQDMRGHAPSAPLSPPPPRRPAPPASRAGGRPPPGCLPAQERVLRRPAAPRGARRTTSRSTRIEVVGLRRRGARRAEVRAAASKPPVARAPRRSSVPVDRPPARSSRACVRRQLAAPGPESAAQEAECRAADLVPPKRSKLARSCTSVRNGACAADSPGVMRPALTLRKKVPPPSPRTSTRIVACTRAHAVEHATPPPAPPAPVPAAPASNCAGQQLREERARARRFLHCPFR